VTLADGDTVSFQDYFVRLRHGVPVRAVVFDQADAQLTDAARAALTEADVVVIAPSNPLVSIGPIRALRGVDELLAARRERVVAVSPIVGGAALKGPADRMLTELGMDASVVGVARLYAKVAAALVIDPADEALAAQVQAEGIRAVVAPSIMATPERAQALARATLAAVR
jgi:LPPG:FO 2-phospho-L-lactate transferase